MIFDYSAGGLLTVGLMTLVYALLRPEAALKGSRAGPSRLASNPALLRLFAALCAARRLL